LLPGNLTSASRDGVVNDHWIRTTHTDTHWVVTIRQPIVLSIPRSDPDLADVVMVLLFEGERTDGRHYLDQARIGRIFRLSRQKTGDRIRLYKQNHRIEDVLGRERHNHHLTPSMVAAIHGLLLEDPFLGASEIRRRLYEQGLLQRADEIGLTTVTEAIKSVDYVAVRWKIEEMLKRGALVPDYQKISQLLLEEMNGLAEIAGKKVGQKIIPIAQLLEPNAGSLSPPKVPTRSSQAELEELLGPEPGTGTLPSGWRVTFIHYFTFGASYRELASFLGVHASTVYRRLVSIRSRLPALAKVLGPLRHSGVVGIDEKYILAPKPHRQGKMARWVYLFIAVDPYTYDLLHAEVYPARTADCARAFLVGLKASGVLKPKAIVTDLWGPYESVIPEMYPGVVHHQCVFHAEQAASTMMRDKLGKEYRSIPEAVTLWKAIIDVFRAGCRRTLIRRYGKLVSQKDSLLDRRPDLAPVFDSLARHFEKLANAYTDRRLSIPLTNNATELVFRCFTRRYKTLAGFETLETARAYVKLWSWYYRFRPFSPDANQRIRNKSPLQIAGYEVHGRTCLDLVMPPPQVEVRS
jgi:transposase-like protein